MIVLVGLLVIVKCVACLGSIYLLAWRSADLSEALTRAAPQKEVNNLYLPLRPLHFFVTRRLEGHPRALASAQKLIRGPVVVSLGGFTTLLFAEVGDPTGALLLALGASTALCAALHFLLAIEEGLIFGPRTRRLFHVRPAATGWLAFLKNWSVVREGKNLILYFVALLYMLIVGLAAFILGFDAVDSQGFDLSGPISLAVVVLTVLLAWLLTILTAPETPPDDFGDATPY